MTYERERAMREQSELEDLILMRNSNPSLTALVSARRIAESERDYWKAQVAHLKKILRHAEEAILWHGAGGFEWNGVSIQAAIDAAFDHQSPVSHIKLTPAEIQSGSSRQLHAEMLIEQLPTDHDGRNSWLLNYGVREQAAKLRKTLAKERDIPELTFDPKFGAVVRQHR